jgi:hypothetical protein
MTTEVAMVPVSFAENEDMKPGSAGWQYPTKILH